MTWDGVVRLPPVPLESLAARHGGRIAAGGTCAPERIVPVRFASAGDIAPVLVPRSRNAAREAAARGAALLVDSSLEGPWLERAREVWMHEEAPWAMAALLDEALVPATAAQLGDGCCVAPSVVLGPRVVLGARVTIGPGAVIGHPGFGWASRKGGGLRPMPQVAGVIIEDDVAIGPLCTIDAGTLSPTRIRRGAKLDAHVHVGHNGEIGEDTIVAAQCGFAGSVTVGHHVLIGGQVGVADHVTIGDRARIAAKSGVIGDVPAGATVAGYPAIARMRWLRALAKLHKGFGPPKG